MGNLLINMKLQYSSDMISFLTVKLYVLYLSKFDMIGIWFSSSLDNDFFNFFSGRGLAGSHKYLKLMWAKIIIVRVIYGKEEREQSKESDW